MSLRSFRQTLAEDLRRYDDESSGFLAFAVAFVFAPGFAVIVLHRLAAALFVRGGIRRVLALLIWRHNTRVSGCHISLRCELGPGLFLPHPTGIVIGDGVTVGPGSTVYQNVTLGLGAGGYPALGSGTIIYAGAVVVGAVEIGERARVGANAFVSKSVGAGKTVAGIPARALAGRRSSQQ